MSKQNRAAKSGGSGKPGAANLGTVKEEKQIPSFEKGGVVPDLQKQTPDDSDQPEAILPPERVKEVMNAGKEDTPGCEPISRLRWEKAQQAERAQHTMGFIEGVMHYGKAYQHYFRFLGLGNNLHGLSVIEIGPADFPALQTCTNFNGIIVEPMPSEHLEQICREKGITLINMPFEDIPVPGGLGERPEGSPLVEIWLLNVMQHVIDPNVFMEKAMQTADRIRFFEPINQPITEYHPHAYTLEDYRRYFGDCVNLYAGGSVEGFHEADCAYGVWIK